MDRKDALEIFGNNISRLNVTRNGEISIYQRKKSALISVKKTSLADDR
ncbi:MAG: hypothetical protein KBG25_08320 [Paludibacteraceae bacterium]|nr:hypothetical protein [Paludibacteraceae bacterium]